MLDSPKAPSALDKPPHQLSGPGKLGLLGKMALITHTYILISPLKRFPWFLKAPRPLNLLVVCKGTQFLIKTLVPDVF